MPGHTNVVDDAEDLPLAIQIRARRRRAQLTTNSVELRDLAGAELINDGVDAILLVTSLPTDEHRCESHLSLLRENAGPDVRLWVIDTTAGVDNHKHKHKHLAAKVRRISGSRSVSRPTSERNTVAAIRSSGWTVTSIERFEVLDDGGVNQVWVDLEAAVITPTDLGPD